MVFDLRGIVLVGPQGHLLCVVAFVPPRAFLGETICEIHLRGVGVLDTHLSPLRAMLICQPCLVCATHLAFLASMHSFCTLAYMFMHEFACRPFYNPMELWTFDPNLHSSSQDTFFLFFFLITCFLPLFVLHTFVCPYLTSSLGWSLACFPFHLFFCLSAGLLLLSLHVHVWSQTLGARVRPLRHKQKRQGCKPTKGNDQQIRGPSPSRVVFSFPLFKPFLQSMDQGSPTPCTLYFSCPLLGLHSLGMAMSVLRFLYLTGFNDPRKSASHICALPQKDQSQLRLPVVVNKALFNLVNTRCGTHHTLTHIIQSIKLGHHNLPHLNP